MLFLVLGLAQLGVALAVRAPRRPGGPGNPWLGVAVAGSVRFPAGLCAVDLAVREAQLRHRPIRVVYANTWASHPAWVDVAPSGLFAERLAAEPRDAIDVALARIAASSTVPATAEVL